MKQVFALDHCKVMSCFRLSCTAAGRSVNHTNDNAQQSRLRALLKSFTPPIVIDAVRSVQRRLRPPPRRIPLELLHDAEFYRPHFSPWEGLGEFKDVMAAVARHSNVKPERVWILYSLAQQARHVPGNFWECGVYKGGTATVLERVVSSDRNKQLHLFDTFAGLPAHAPDRDFHRQGLYSDTSLESVKNVVGRDDHIVYHAGFIPDTFENMTAEHIAFAHVDVAIYQSVLDCCVFIYPRMSTGGFIVFDDYGFRSCPGARAAVDEFFADKPERPLVLPTQQAVVIKLP